MQGSERALVPLSSELLGPPGAPDGQIDVPPQRGAGGGGLAVGAQRRAVDAAGGVGGRGVTSRTLHPALCTQHSL